MKLFNTDITSLRLVLTDTKSGKQLRIFCRRPKQTSLQIESRENWDDYAVEYFCEELSFSDKLP